MPLISAKADIIGHEFETVSVFFDSGSQHNFIVESLASRLKLKTIEKNVAITINGFTGEQRFLTRIVEFPMIIDNKSVKVKFICMTELLCKFRVPHLEELIQVLNADNKELAFQPYYSNNLKTVSNIQCLIGSEEWQIVASWPTTLIGSTDEKQSTYYTVNSQVVPIGPIKRFLQNYTFEKTIQQTFAYPNNVHSSHSFVNASLINTSLSKYEVETTSKTMINDFEQDYDSNDILDIAEYSELNHKCDHILNLNQSIPIDEQLQSEKEVTKFVMDNSTQDPSTGRFTMAIPWIGRFKNSLKSNEKLARQVLHSVHKKYSNDLNVLKSTDDVFKKQIEMNMIEIIHDLDQYKNIYPRCSFLSHFPLVKNDRLTSKVRVIYMANLAEKNVDGSPGVSLNQTVHPGFCKNAKIATAFSFARFNKNLLCFDISKAYHQLAISEDNSSKFLFFWFRNVNKSDFTPIVYKFNRVIFGMSVAPFLLTCALNKFLMNGCDDPTLSKVENEKLNELKQLIYHCSYVDNLFVGCDTEEDLHYVHDSSVRIFNKNLFPLQQFVTNHADFQSKLDKQYKEETPNTVKILGMNWNRDRDTLIAPDYKMNSNANTKRQILREINRNYDLMGTNIPILNRAKLFMHKLQSKESLKWDNTLDHNDIHEWNKIAKQFNHYKAVEISRCMGSRKASFDLCIFSDASKQFLGYVSYLKNNDTNQISFLVASNKMLDKTSRCRSTPVLEFAAIEYSVQKGLDLYQEMTDNVVPINIVDVRLFSDSTVALSWLNKSENLLTKMQKRCVYVNNRINNVVQKCREIHTVHFTHIGTSLNSADYVTREFSSKRLNNTTFISGPPILSENLNVIDWIIVPNPTVENCLSIPHFSLNAVTVEENKVISYSEIINFSKFSSLRLAIKTLVVIESFVIKLKTKLYLRDEMKYAHLKVGSASRPFGYWERILLAEDQQKEFPDLFKFFKSKQNIKKKIPPLVAQMNLVLDPIDNLIKVKSKMGKLLSSKVSKFPLLLGRKSHFMKIVVEQYHRDFNHFGAYFLLNQLRRKYFILKAFSSIKRILKDCVHCKRFNSRSVKVNTNEYRSFMVNARERIFNTVFIDYVGPYYTKIKEIKQKTYLVIFKCFWSKAINIQVVTSADTKSFLMAFQNHIYEFGLPQIVHTDAGTNFSAGFNWLREVFNNIEIKDYFDQLNVQIPTFNQYPRGSLSKGIPGFVESGVKLVRRLIQGSIKNNVLDFEQFCSVIRQVICYANKRPLNNFSALRDQSINSDFRILTPEILKLGYETNVLEVNIPQNEPDDWQPEQLVDHRIAYKNLRQLLKIKNNIREGYHTEFLYSLMDAATHLKGRYLPIHHQILELGDTVLIRDPFIKSAQFPMGIITKVIKNNLDEVTQVSVRKANHTNVTRDVSDIILLVRNEVSSDGSVPSGGDTCGDMDNASLPFTVNVTEANSSNRRKHRRAAAIQSEGLTREILRNN